MNLIGIDIGGTKICVCVGNEHGDVFASKRIQTQPLGGWKNGLDATRNLILETLQETKIPLQQIRAIGISSPGPISTKLGQMFNPPNLPQWENAPLVSYFEKTFQKKVVLNNDANAAAVAEYQFGSAKGTKNLVYLTCSTGMGGGAIVDGKLVQGVSDTAAEVGHFVLDINGPPCPCGQRGCFEVYCGGAALAKRMQKELGKEVDAAYLVHQVAAKDPYALKIWEEFIVRLAQGIGTVLMNFNPEVVLLGTIAVHAGPLLLEPLKKELPRFAWKQNIESCRIEASAIGDRLSELSGLALALTI